MMVQTNGKTIVNSWNEWDPLKRVIVGRCDGSCQPNSDPGWDYHCPRAGFEFGPMPDDMIEKATIQMDNFSKILAERGVIVDRAVPIDFNQKASTPDWEVAVMHGCMPPRDVFLPVGNEILECTMSIRARWFEYLCYRPILEKYFIEDTGFQWTSAPRPRLTDESYIQDYYYNYNNVWTKAEKKERILERRWHLTEKEFLFDAADGMRFGKDIIWQASSVSNGLGIDWLKRHFEEKGLRLHVVQFTGDFHAWHIDVHLVPLGPGLCMYNPEWHYITPELEKLSKINDWELVPAAEPVHVYDVTCGVVGDRKRTEWISMNTFSIDPKTVCVEANETKYMEQLDKLGFEVIPVSFADVFPFGGGLHCATVDIYREGNCEDYFPNQVEGFESIEEMMAKLQSGGDSQYDIVCLGDYNYHSALKLNLIQPLDHTRIPNVKNIMPRFKTSYFDPGNKYHVPWHWGFTGMIYRKDRLKADQVRSWSILFDPKANPGPFYLLDSTQEMLAITLRYLGFDPNSINPQELKAAMDLLIKTKKRKECLGFKGGVGARSEVAAGTVNASITYNGDAIRVIDEDPAKMNFTVAKEGAHIFVDTLAITRKAPNPDAAHKWMNWILEPEIGAWISNYVRFATPNEASMPLITKEDLKNPNIYPSKEVRDKLFYLKDPGPNMKMLDQAWTRIKAQ